MEMLAAAFAEVTGQNPEHLVEIGHQRAVGCLLNAEILEDRDASRCRDTARGATEQPLIDATALRVVTDRDTAENLAHLLDTMDMLGEKGFIAKVLLNQNGCQRR